MDSPLELLDQLRPARLLVFGDVMLDRYVWGDVSRISPEAPVPVLRPDLEEVRLGGAASVAILAQGLGAQVSLCSATGDDSLGRTVVKLLEDTKIGHSGLIMDPDRPTTDKLRFLGRTEGRHTQQLFRVDRECCEPIHGFVEEHLAEVLADQISQHDLVLVSDYAKGVCSSRLLAGLFALARDAGIPVLVDPARITDYSRYRGAHGLLPNRSEAELATGKLILNETAATHAAAELAERFDVAAVLLKLDRDGLLLWERERNTVTVPAQTRQVYDVTGAGDMVLAMSGLAVASHLSLADAAILANVAAGLEVEKLGVAVVSREEIRQQLVRHPGRNISNKLITRDQMAAVAACERRLGRKVVFTNGCFDLLHVGHVTYLEQAAALGDVLIVGVNSDESVAKLKGASRPILQEADRASMLAALAFVDYVVIFDEPTPHALLELIRPEVLVKGGTYALSEVVGHEVVEAYGGRVCVVTVVPHVSTSQIISRIKCEATSHENTSVGSGESPPSRRRPTGSVGSLPCLHRGQITGAVHCNTCKSGLRVHVYECTQFGYCTIPRASEGYQACQSCTSRAPPLQATAPNPAANH